eukprot:CAMPEP_0183414344 /NCGR_PEP_ID=MMETSP0370-20130417/22329_2 /TAXON_ID=268820 /ORGANISM="Peridinium aciculiferum, Strain PAER-2" /LENGTH=99 /DNA_ID=CAMNT_0025597657 /DNA_START=99 /DNA_END=394 /DNA_ORIENTATION=-
MLLSRVATQQSGGMVGALSIVLAPPCEPSYARARRNTAEGRNSRYVVDLLDTATDLTSALQRVAVVPTATRATTAALAATAARAVTAVPAPAAAMPAAA